MNVYVWHYVEQCSDSYHCGGGVVVFAPTEERARELANACPGCSIKPEEKPDVRPSDGDEKVYIMQDAGCC